LDFRDNNENPSRLHQNRSVASGLREQQATDKQKDNPNPTMRIGWNGSGEAKSERNGGFWAMVDINALTAFRGVET